MKLANKIAVAARIFSARISGNRIPLNVSYFITNRCNLNCSYCNIPTNRHYEEMRTDAIIAMLKEFHTAGMVKFSCSGGEPLMREDLGEIIDFVASLGVVTSITTNGMLIPQRASSLRSLTTMLISIDGDNAYQKLTRASRTSRIVKNIEQVKKA